MAKILVQAVKDAVVYTKEGTQISSEKPQWVDNTVTVIKALKSGHLKEFSTEKPAAKAAPAKAPTTTKE